MNVSSDEVIQNIKKASEKYQEILFYLMQGKGSLIPQSLIDNDKIRLILSETIEQITASPNKFININLSYLDKFKSLVESSIDKFSGNSSADPVFIPSPKDKRFKDVAWEENVYFDFIKQFYLMSSEWMNKIVEQYELEPELKTYLKFANKQFIDAMSPSNFIICNPEVMRESLESGWQNIVKGLDNFLNDIKKSEDILNIQITDKSAFKLGENIAATKGKVIMQNDLMQLICYEPKKQTYAIPIFIVPPCINKYYILDLSPENSFIKWLVDNNFQVFVISWVNPDKTLANKTFENYVKEGIIDGLEYVKNLGFENINTVGYCIGGTMLSIAVSYLKTNNQNYINSVSLLATMLDFKNPGEIGIFINESSILAIESNMQDKGYFDGRYLSNSFSLLRSNDLVWSFFVNNYLLGKSPLPFDILFWNADPTNLPAQMHSYYLRNMYLNNLLKTPGNIKIESTPINLSNITCPTFFLATSEDHIAPWKSIYEGLSLLNCEKEFCLAGSGHVAGIINPPSNKKYNYKTNKNSDYMVNDWYEHVEEHQGSWWPYWKNWLEGKSGKLIQSFNYKAMNFIEDAPGSYVKTSQIL